MAGHLEKTIQSTWADWITARPSEYGDKALHITVNCACLYVCPLAC